MLETNYKVLVFESCGTSERAQKAKDYAEFLKTPTLRPLSLQFQTNDLLVCHVPRKVEDAYNGLLKGTSNDIKERYMVYKVVTLKIPTGRRAPDVKNTSASFQMHFADVF